MSLGEAQSQISQVQEGLPPRPPLATGLIDSLLESSVLMFLEHSSKVSEISGQSSTSFL